MAGKRQKHPDVLAFQRGGRHRALQPMTHDGGRPAPACPEGVSPEARQAWRELWESPLANTFADSDLPALYRWLWWTDQWFDAARYVERYGPVTRGQRGDEVLRTKVRWLRICEASLAKLEEAFGMTPLARLRLGITFTAIERMRRRTPATREPDGEDPRRLLMRG